MLKLVRVPKLRQTARAFHTVLPLHISLGENILFGMPYSGGAYKILGFNETSFKLLERASKREFVHTGSLILTTTQLLPWNVKSWENFTEKDLGTIMQVVNTPLPTQSSHKSQLARGNPAKLVVLGTGKNMQILESKVGPHSVYITSGLGFEVLSTAVACKTYNFLVDEGRQVVAALLPAGS